MNDKYNGIAGGGLGLFGVLFVVFLVLKLTHVIEWSWWLVTAPLWGGFLLGVIVFIIACVLISKHPDWFM